MIGARVVELSCRDVILDEEVAEEVSLAETGESPLIGVGRTGST